MKQTPENVVIVDRNELHGIGAFIESALPTDKTPATVR